MTEWGRATYGDPCRECGYDWSVSLHEAVALVAGIPDRYTTLLRGRTGSERRADLTWCALAYVCHVVDNLRIWAERLAAAAMSGPTALSGYDNERLASARAYEGVPLPGALWSLGRAVADWRDAVGLAGESGVVLMHPDMGKLVLLDVCRGNAHDAHHHGWDIEQILIALP